MPPSNPSGADPRGGVLTEKRPELERTPPRAWRVLLHNDDYTTQEFVVWVLQVVFHKGTDEATRLMLDVHTKGKGACGVFTLDVARTKAQQVERLARRHEHPLQCELEAVETE